MEIMFTVFSAFEFVENPFREWTEALGTSRKNIFFSCCYENKTNDAEFETSQICNARNNKESSNWPPSWNKNL